MQSAALATSAAAVRARHGVDYALIVAAVKQNGGALASVPTSSSLLLLLALPRPYSPPHLLSPSHAPSLTISISRTLSGASHDRVRPHACSARRAGKYILHPTFLPLTSHLSPLTSSSSSYLLLLTCYFALLAAQYFLSEGGKPLRVAWLTDAARAPQLAALVACKPPLAHYLSTDFASPEARAAMAEAVADPSAYTMATYLAEGDESQSAPAALAPAGSPGSGGGGGGAGGTGGAGRAGLGHGLEVGGNGLEVERALDADNESADHAQVHYAQEVNVVLIGGSR